VKTQSASRHQGAHAGRSQRAQKGFSLAEILVTLAIAGILAGVAIPNLSKFLRNVKLNSLTGSMVSSMQLARSEAIKMNRPVLVCRNNSSGSGCSSLAESDWTSRGWRVCFAQLAADVCEASTTELPNPIRVEGPVDSTFATLVATTVPIRFSPTGSQGTAGASTVTITITGTWSGAVPATITVAPSGLIKGSRV
jgi:type IV fimbrial biogenesis protein FimT